MELRLPAPCLVVLVGASGAGKTTWAHRHFPAGEIVSSDVLRSMAGTGEDDQAASPTAFEILNRLVVERMRRKLTTVIDTTGLDADDRRSWVAIAHTAGVPAHAVMFDTPPATCEQRNAQRDSPLPRQVLRNQLKRFRTVREVIEDDGFDGIHAEQPVAMVTPQVHEATSRGPRHPGPVQRHTFGLSLSRFQWSGESLAERLVWIARRAEDAGFRDIWLMDHFRQIPQVGRPWEDLPETYTTLSFLAGVTSTLRLGALVTPVTHRHPVVLGKMLATLDVLSGGRAICGLGIGWNEGEHRAYGIDFPPVATRYSMLSDTLEMLPLLWGKGSPAFHGRVITAEELTCYPRPAQERIPILVGGSGEKRTLRLAARLADACNLFGDPEKVRNKVQVLRGHCEEFGRPAEEVEVTHLTSAMADSDRRQLRKRVDRLRSRSISPESYSARHNAGTVEDLIALFSAYSEAGAQHSIVAIPDVGMEGSVESFAPVVSSFTGT